jgi:hypothetical protein
MLSIDLIQHILSYANELRVLKIKMDNKNIKYIFENDRDVYQYLTDKLSPSYPCLGDGIYLHTVKILNNSNVHMNNVFTVVEKFFKRWNKDVSYEVFCRFLEIIIKDYIQC